MIEILSELAKPLLSISSKVWPSIRRIHKERQAGQNPYIFNNDILDKGFEETYNRISTGNFDDKWWENLLNKIGHKIITPEFLRKPALQEWLSKDDVKNDFNRTARDRIMGSVKEDDDARKRLQYTYSENTGEREELAAGPIEVVISILAAGCFGSLDDQHLRLAGIMQEGFQRNEEGFRSVENRIDDLDKKFGSVAKDPHVIKAHSMQAESELCLILKRRSIDTDQVTQEIEGLVQKINSENGDLLHTKNSVKAEILYWAARLNATNIKTIVLANEYCKKLYRVAPDYDVRIIDALIRVS